MLYQWLILQDGSLPLKPDGSTTDEAHACTSTLIWPAGTKPTRDTSVLVDPCFTDAGWEDATRRLQDNDLGLDCVGYYFETHQHFDHMLRFPAKALIDQRPGFECHWQLDWLPLTQDTLRYFPGVDLVRCPGHSPDLQAIRCETADGETWILGDAILDRQWLEHWMYYWPNQYVESEVAETWRSVGMILETACMTIPGHGPPIPVDAELIQALVDGFPAAAQAEACPEVARALAERLRKMS